MASESKKHGDFIAEPMGDKPVIALPGIGEVIGAKLVNMGFVHANAVFGQYLVLQRDEGNFKNWLEKNAAANPYQQRQCYNCMKAYYEQFMQ